MKLVTTDKELQAIAILLLRRPEAMRQLDALLRRPEAKQQLDTLLIDKFWADQSYFTTKEDTCCAWASLPLDEKIEYVHAWIRDDGFSPFLDPVLSSINLSLAKKQPVA